MCSRIYLGFLLAFFCLALFSFPQKIFAASISMQNAPSQIGVNDIYTVNTTLSISAKDGTQYYLRGVFYVPGTTNYCGYTWNGTSWYNGPYTTNTGWQNLLAVTVTNSSWSGQLQAKIDANDTNCSTSGQYAFKIERFTGSGTGSFDTQTEQTVFATIPTPTPTPIPPTSVPPALITPTSPPTTKTTSAITQNPKVTTNVLLTKTPTVEDDSESTFGAVLGTMSADTFATTIPSRIAGEADHRKTEIHLFPLLFILGGFILLASCGILIFSKSEKGQDIWKKIFPQKA